MMNRRQSLTLIASLAGLGISGTTAAWWWTDGDDESEVAGDAIELNWEDLVQPGFEPAPDPFITMTSEEIDKLFDGSDESKKQLAEYEAEFNFAPVNDTLDGKLVTLPGYVVPLDFDGNQTLAEFLLVPYFGACIHTPPPPANQIVLATLEKAVTLDDPYLPVQLRGVLRTDPATTPMAETGYRMDVIKVEPFEEP